MPRPYGIRGGWRATFAGAVLEYTMRAGFTGQGPATLAEHTADGEQPIDLPAARRLHGPARPPPAACPARRPRRPGRRGRRGRPGPGPAAWWPAAARPPPAGCPAGWPRRPGCRGRRGRRDHGAAARWPGPARPPPAGCPAAGFTRGTPCSALAVRKRTACRTRRSTALRAARPAGTPSHQTSPLDSPVTGSQRGDVSGCPAEAADRLF